MAAKTKITVFAALILAGVGSQPVQAQDMSELGLTFMQIGKNPGDCLLVAELPFEEGGSPKPLLNSSGGGYAVGKYEDCPTKLEDGTEIGVYARYEYRDQGLRLHADWGTTKIFKHYSQVDTWYHQRYRFDWVAPEDQ